MALVSYFKAPIFSVAPPQEDLTLEEIYYRIKSDAFRFLTKELRQLASSEERKKFKRKTFDYVTFYGTFSKRDQDNLIIPSGYICLDFDHTAMSPEDIKTALRKDPNFDPLLMFVSPSGDGLKVVVKIDTSICTADVYYKGFYAYFNKFYGINLDMKSRDIARGCFLPKDKNVYYIGADGEANAKIFDPRPYLDEVSSSARISHDVCKKNMSMDDYDHVENVIKSIESQGISIAPDYDQYLYIGFAFADSFGESGRDYFHRVCRLDGKYNAQDADRQFDACLKSKGSGITLGTFYKYAKDKGIDISMCPPCPPVATSQATEETPVLPTFSDKVAGKLPRLLEKIISRAQNVLDRDMVLLAAITIISSCMSMVKGIYHQKAYTPHLYFFIEGRAASGKGKVSALRRLLSTIDKKNDEAYKIAIEEYQTEYQAWLDSEKKDRAPREPERVIQCIPDDSTSASFVRDLANNHGEGLIFTTEADTLVEALSSPHGHFSAALRKAFHHEPISRSRRTDKEYTYIDFPKIALFMCGTPNQTAALIKGVEDGLFSRFQFYHIEGKMEWMDPFVDADLEPMDDYFAAVGEEFYTSCYIPLKNGAGISFSWTPMQKKQFNSYFKNLLSTVIQRIGADMSSSVLRLGLVTFRISMIVGTLKAFERGHAGSGQIICDDDSFGVAMKITETLMEHDLFIYNKMPKTQSSAAAERINDFYAALPKYPSKFGRKDYHSVACTLGLNPRTVDRYVAKLYTDGYLTKDSIDGLYIKPNSPNS